MLDIVLAVFLAAVVAIGLVSLLYFMRGRQ